MRIRLARKSDVLEILTLFSQARDYFKQLGIDQWQGDYPNIHTILQDISLSQCYIAKENEVMLGVIVISFVRELSYEQQLTSCWNTSNDYTVIHRLATNKNYPKRRLTEALLRFAEEISTKEGYVGIRTDTHEMNDGMRYVLTKTGYRYVGELSLLDGSPRVAYDKILVI